MRICFIVKYPPIQGGVSMSSYWLARQLAERGHEIHVVTNANEVEDDYRIHMDEDDRAWWEPRFDSGGFVQVHLARTAPYGTVHIPQSNPFVAKLSSVATQVIRRYHCEAIFGYYLQPYGLAAHLASHWTGVPYMVRHAGSDLGRLMKQPGLTTAYREVVKAAHGVWTTPTMRTTFVALGVAEEDIWFGPAPALPDVFSPETAPLDLNALLGRLAAEPSSHVRNVLINTRPLDPATPIIGIYGKVGETKGSFDLVHALSRLKKEGVAFNFVALTQGTALPDFKRAIREGGLDDRTWLFPFLPHWRMPSFLRACTAVCFLEREFPIAFHTPTVPREVLACGTCLLLSREIADKQVSAMRSRFADGDNVLLVENPRDHAGLARQLAVAITDPDNAARIGRNGAALLGESQVPVGGDAQRQAAELIEQQFMRIRDTVTAERRRDATPDVALRRQRLRARLPWTSALLAESWSDMVQQYCDSHPSDADDQFHDAVTLCDFLGGQLAARNGDAAHVHDALRYEKHHNQLYIDYTRRDTWPERVEKPENGAGTRYAKRAPQPIGKRALEEMRHAGGDVLSLRPVKMAGVHVEVFSRDFKELARRIRSGEAAADLPETKTIIVFKRELNFVGVELKINEATKHFLDLCDGRHTVQTAIAKMGEFYQRTTHASIAEGELTEEVFDVLRELTGKEIVRLSADH